MNRAEIQTALEAAGLPAGDWVVHGSAVMVLHGLIPEAGDVDVIARGAAWQIALTLGESVNGVEDVCVRLAPGLEIWSGWLGEDVGELIDCAQTTDGVPCVSLSEVLRFKVAMNRPKDQEHISLLRAALQRTNA